MDTLWNPETRKRKQRRENVIIMTYTNTNVTEIEYHGIPGWEFIDGTKVLLPFGSHIFEVYNANQDLIGNIDADGQIANIIDLLRNGHNPIKENWEMEMVCNA